MGQNQSIPTQSRQGAPVTAPKPVSIEAEPAPLPLRYDNMEQIPSTAPSMRSHPASFSGRSFHSHGSHGFSQFQPIAADVEGLPGGQNGDNPVYFRPMVVPPMRPTSKKPKKKSYKSKKKGSTASSKKNNRGMHGSLDPYHPAPYSIAVERSTGRQFLLPTGAPPLPGPPFPGPPVMLPDGQLIYGGMPYYHGLAHEERDYKPRTSAVISTFDDPKEDKIDIGDEVQLRKKRATIHLDGRNNNNNNDGSVRDKNVASVVVGGETLGPQSVVSETGNNVTINNINYGETNSSLLPDRARSSQYVTYIKEVTPPPTPPPPPVEEEVTIYEGFIEVGEADTNVAQMLVDEDKRVQTEVAGEMLAIETTQITDGLEEQLGTVSFSDVGGSDIVMLFDYPGSQVATTLKAELEGTGAVVWMGGVFEGITHDEVADTARAVMEAHMVVVVLTETSSQRGHIRDLTSLANVTNSVIYPVAVEDKEIIESCMTTESKLQLKGLQWIQMRTGWTSNSSEIQGLVATVRDELAKWRNRYILDEDYGQVSSLAGHRKDVSLDIREVHSVKGSTEDISNGYHEEENRVSDSPGVEKMMTASEFWKQYFPHLGSVSWDGFRGQLRSHYEHGFAEELPRSVMPSLMDFMRHEMTMGTGKQGDQPLVTNTKFVEFCMNGGEDVDVWERIIDVARDHQAVLDVLNKDSAVRPVVVESIGNHGSPAVVVGLRQLLTDDDPEIRSQAVTSLSQCMVVGDETSFTMLLTALDDPEPNVRAASCNAMAQIGAQLAVDRLRRLKRSDANAFVRHTAEQALDHLGDREQLAEVPSTRVPSTSAAQPTNFDPPSKSKRSSRNSAR